MTDPNPAQIVPEQADREAAADWLMAPDNDSWSHAYIEAVRAGTADDCPLVQAFARHRLLGRDEGMREADVAEAVAVLEGWLADTPRYMADAPKAQHYQRNVRVLEAAIRSLRSRPVKP
jgi:hypothetical protein